MLGYVTTYPILVGLFTQFTGSAGIRKPWVNLRFSSLYSGLDVTQTENMHQVTLFLARRYLIGISIALLRNYYFLQLQTFMVTTLVVICFTMSTLPFKHSFLNVIELINEFCVILTCYVLHGFSEFIVDFNVRYNLGWFYINVVAFVFVLNLIYMIYMILTTTKKGLKITNKIKKDVLKACCAPKPAQSKIAPRPPSPKEKKQKVKLAAIALSVVKEESVEDSVKQPPG